MAFLSEFMNVGTMGESGRLDYAIREHEDLKERFDTLVRLLEEKGVLTGDERVRLLAPKDGTS
jgi:hypothetical protein